MVTAWRGFDDWDNGRQRPLLIRTTTTEAKNCRAARFLVNANYNGNIRLP